MTCDIHPGYPPDIWSSKRYGETPKPPDTPSGDCAQCWLVWLAIRGKNAVRGETLCRILLAIQHQETRAAVCEGEPLKPGTITGAYADGARLPGRRSKMELTLTGISGAPNTYRALDVLYPQKIAAFAISPPGFGCPRCLPIWRDAFGHIHCGIEAIKEHIKATRLTECGGPAAEPTTLTGIEGAPNTKRAADLLYPRPFEFLSCPPSLAKFIELPFVQDDGGCRHAGLSAIKGFVRHGPCGCDTCSGRKGSVRKR